MNLLLAEDDPELARQLVLWLKKAGHEVTWHEGGIDALRTALVRAFDVVILDVNLPGQNGFSIVEEMRKQEETVPVLFLTARDSVTDRVRGFAAGGDDYLTKPFAMEELLARIDALPVASKVLTPGEINRGVAKRDVDSKRMTPATRADVYESKSQRRDAAAPSTALCWAWS